MGAHRYSGSSIAPGAVDEGDILLVTQHPTNALAALIVELDRSPGGFSHARVADDHGMIVSSYPHYQPDDLLDLGGLRHDPLEHFWDEQQDVHRVTLPEGANHRDAAAGVREYPDDREGAFGFAKVVIVAAALHALLPENLLDPKAEYEVVSRAIEAGYAWKSDDDFYCAEFVAHLYGRPFSLGELRPPPADGVDDGPVPEDRIGAGLTPAAITVGASWLSLLASWKQVRTLWALKRAIWRYDPAFFHEGIEVVFGAQPIPQEQFDRAKDASKLDDATVLPPALVTPRMLEMWGHATQLLERPPAPGSPT